MSLNSSTHHLLLETIKIEDGVIHNLNYHQQRCTQSRKKLYQSTDVLLLENVIIPPQKGCYRCRIVYNSTIQSIEYIPYLEKTIKTLKIVSSTLKYELKYADRASLDRLLQAYENVDDIIIEKDGYITDTSIANLAFYDGTTWYTPKKPLLHGTMRQKLLDEGFLQKRDIKKETLSQYTHVALMNAMIGFKILKKFNIIKN